MGIIHFFIKKNCQQKQHPTIFQSHFQPNVACTRFSQKWFLSGFDCQASPIHSESRGLASPRCICIVHTTPCLYLINANRSCFVEVQDGVLISISHTLNIQKSKSTAIKTKFIFQYRFVFFDLSNSIFDFV